MAKKYYAVRVGKVPEHIRHGKNVEVNTWFSAPRI